MKTQTESLAYVIFQNGASIIGVGTTKEEAYVDALEWMDSSIEEVDENGTVVEIRKRTVQDVMDAVKTYSRVDGELVIAPCTIGLYNYVKHSNNPDPAKYDRLEDGTICTEEEYEAANA